jgi:1-acyl-sn-glycerol-3-phosphate acyltransferase
MGAAMQLARGLGTLGYFFGGAPLVAFRTARSSAGDPASLRAPFRAHAARARRLAGISLDVCGEENVPPEPYVLVYNQTSLVDDLGNIEVFWRMTNRNVMAAEYGLLPFVTAATRRLNVLLLRRGNRAVTDRALAELTDAAARGERISVGAEGRLSPDGEVGHFKRGAFLIAIRARVKVLPISVQGGREILAPGSLRLRPGVLRYRIGPPIETTGLDERAAPDLAESTRGRVAALYEDSRRQAARDAKLVAHL